MQLDWNGGICASAQRRSRQEMREAAQSWGACARRWEAMRLTTSRRYETGAKRRLRRTIPSRKQARLADGPRTLTKSGQAQTKIPTDHVSRARDGVSHHFMFSFVFPTLIGTLPVIQPHGCKHFPARLCRCAIVVVEVGVVVGGGGTGGVLLMDRFEP